MVPCDPKFNVRNDRVGRPAGVCSRELIFLWWTLALVTEVTGAVPIDATGQVFQSAVENKY